MSNTSVTGVTVTTVVAVTAAVLAIDTVNVVVEPDVSIAVILAPEAIPVPAILSPTSAREAMTAVELPKFFHLQGTIQILVIYDEDGNITEISMADSELNIPEIDNCILKAAQSINYPKTMEGMVQISFLLEVL